MKAKIRRSMVLILGITLLVSYGLLSLFFYKQGMQTLREEYGRKHAISVKRSESGDLSIWKNWIR